MRGDVPRHGGSGQREDDERGDHDAGFRSVQESRSSIGQTRKSAQISSGLKGLWPVTPTTPPMNAEAAMVSKNRAKPSFCSLVYLDGISVPFGDGSAAKFAAIPYKVSAG